MLWQRRHESSARASRAPIGQAGGARFVGRSLGYLRRVTSTVDGPVRFDEAGGKGAQQKRHACISCATRFFALSCWPRSSRRLLAPRCMAWIRERFGHQRIGELEVEYPKATPASWCRPCGSPWSVPEDSTALSCWRSPPATSIHFSTRSDSGTEFGDGRRFGCRHDLRCAAR